MAYTGGSFKLPSTPASTVPYTDLSSGQFRLFIDSVNNVPAVVNSAGTITYLGGMSAAQVEALVGAMLTNTSTINLTYNSSGETIAATINTSSVTNSLLANMAAYTVKGNSTSSTAGPTDLSQAQLTSLITALGLSQIAAIGNSTILGNVSGSSSSPTALSVSQVTTLLGLGTLAYLSSVPLNDIAAITNNTVLGNVSGSSTTPVALTQTQLTSLITNLNLTQLSNITASSIVGNNSGTSGTPTALTVTQVQTLLGLGALAYLSVVPLADIAAIGNSTVLGNVSGSSSSPTALTQTQLTSLVNPATSSLSGALTAAQYTKLTNLVTGLNGWIDVTQQSTPVLTSNSAATNNSNLATIMSNAASGSTLYFPGGFYPFSAVIAVPAKVFVFQGSVAGINGSLTAFEWTSNVGGDLITLTSSNYYTQFRDIGFLTSVTQTAGAVVNTGSNANINFYRCVFSGLSSTTPLFNCINYTGTAAGEISIVQDCQFTNFSGTAIIGGSNLSTCVVSQITINGTLSSSSSAACGINVQLGGAFQIHDSDIIGCTNNLLINPTSGNVVASVWCINTYFDNSTGSCIKITGAGATVRTKFTNCSFTVASNASPANAVEVSSTYAYGNNGMGLDFTTCNIINTFGSTGVGIGINATGVADFTVRGCTIAGWATGISVTPSSSAGMTQPLITSNFIGPAGGYAGNTTGILLNAGSFTYGTILIGENDLSGNTTPLTDNSTLGTGTAATGFRSITGNVGLVIAPTANYTATTIPLTTVTNVDSRGGLFIPANPRPSSGRITVMATNAATAQTLTATLRFGTTNTSSDTAILTQAYTAGTAAVGSGKFVVEWELISATSMIATLYFINGNNAATGISAQASPFQLLTSLTAPATVATTSNSWLGLYFSSATASAITIRSVKYEVQSQ